MFATVPSPGVPSPAAPAVPLVAVAHGSRDPRSARAIAAALERLRARHPEWDVRLAFLDLNAPSVGQVIDAIADAGHDRAVVAPLLLGSAFHARVDLPAIIADAQARHPFLEVITADILGADAELVAGARASAVATGVSLTDPDVGIAVCAVGSRRPEANSLTRNVTAALVRGTAWRHARTCFATAASPTVAAAVAELRAEGAQSIVVVPWMLAPGVLWDRVLASMAVCRPDVRFSAPLTGHANLAAVIERRYRDALADVHSARRIA